jgi:hypothetical protein
MRFVMLAMMASALLVAGEDKAQANKAAASKTAATDRPAGVPADAQEIQLYLYRYTDSHGKKWLYRQTPFGLSKWEDKPVDAAAASARASENSVPVKVLDQGDSYRFEKDTPFGPTHWERRKSELTESEAALVKLDQDRRTKTAEKP